MAIKHYSYDKNINDKIGKKFFGANKIIKANIDLKIQPLNEYNYIFDLITTNGSFDYGGDLLQ